MCQLFCAYCNGMLMFSPMSTSSQWILVFSSLVSLYSQFISCMDIMKYNKR